MVASGIKPSCLITDRTLTAAVQRLCLDWTDESAAEGFSHVYGQQRRAARELVIAGEVFLRLRPRRPEDGLVAPLHVQRLPGEIPPLCCSGRAATGTIIRQGIEFDRIAKGWPITSCAPIPAT